MMTLKKSKREVPALIKPALMCAFLSLASSVMSAQSPLDQAWTVLQAGAEDKSSDQRAATMRVLQLIPGDAKAVSMAEKGLQDKETEVRGAAALSLGAMQSKSAIPALLEVGKSDREGSVVMAVGKALIQIGNETGYEVFYAVITGERKSGDSLIAGQEKELNALVRNPKQMETMAFEQGIGYVPFGGIGFQAYQTIHASEEKAPILKAACLKVLAKDPDPRSMKPLITAASDKHWLVRAAAFDALARRGDPALLPNAASGLNDDKVEVKLTAAAAVIYLSTITNKTAK